MKKETVNLGIQDVWPIALVFIITGIGVAFGFDIIDDVSDDFVNGSAGCNATDTSKCGYAFNATEDASAGINNLMDKLPTIALVIVAAILITILVRNLGGLTS